jgi:hypothetical protein
MSPFFVLLLGFLMTAKELSMWTPKISSRLECRNAKPACQFGSFEVGFEAICCAGQHVTLSEVMP